MAISAHPSRRRMEERPGPAGPPIVVSVGGSVLLRGDDDAGYLERLAELVRRVGRRVPLVVTTGGGRTAREYIRLGRELGLTDVELDELGIDVTRLHARLLAGRIGLPTATHPPTTVREAVEALRHGSPVGLGGTEPGHTTDAVAALVAVRVRAARLVNATDVDAVYDADPRTHPNARRLATLAWPAFLDLLVRGAAGGPGQHFPFDRSGAEALARAGIPLAIVAGRDLAQVEKALTGAPFDGTVVGGPGGGPS
jgi:uridylate kinase